jgi:hypothetical protein
LSFEEEFVLAPVIPKKKIQKTKHTNTQTHTHTQKKKRNLTHMIRMEWQSHIHKRVKTTPSEVLAFILETAAFAAPSGALRHRCRLKRCLLEMEQWQVAIQMEGGVSGLDRIERIAVYQVVAASSGMWAEGQHRNEKERKPPAAEMLGS